MKTKTVVKIAIASMLCAPSCMVEHGIVIDSTDSADERALYVNVIRKNKAKQKPMHVQSGMLYNADRKLFFVDSTYNDTFSFIGVGDTISFYNMAHEKYIDMGRKKHRIRDINGIREEDIVVWMNTAATEHQR